MVALADFEVVEVMRRRDLDRAGAGGLVRVVVTDDRDAASDQRQDNMLADQVLVADVFRIDRNGGVAEHGFGPGGGDDDVVTGLVGVDLGILVIGNRMLVGHAVGQRVAEMPQVSLDLDLLDLEVGDRRQQLRIPVDQPLVLVDQPFLVEADKHFQHRARQPLVHGEALARPVARCAKPLELVEDHAAGLVFPLPDLFDERFAPDLAAVDLPLGQLPLDHHLRGNARVVHARLPEHVLAQHAMVAHQNILKRVVERVPHVQRAGHIRRRDHDAKRIPLRLGAGASGERIRLCPACRDFRLYGRGVIGFFEHNRVTVCI